jgi:hypothetical protein
MNIPVEHMFSRLLGLSEPDAVRSSGGGRVAWLLRERATGCEWRVGNSDLAWEIGGYDTARFELHVLDEAVVGAPDGRPCVARQAANAGYQGA